MKIYVLYSANEPSTAVEIGKFLEKEHEIIYLTDAFELWNEQEAVVIDIVKGLDDVVLIEDVSQFLSKTPNTAHDLDLGFFLKLQKEVSNQKIAIIGIPEKAAHIKEKVSSLLSAYLEKVGRA